MTTLESHSAAETIAFGQRLADNLGPGDVVALHGELGAGKTCLVKGIACGLGVTQDVTSPTFAIVHEYRGVKHHWLNGKLDHEEFPPAVAAYRAQLTALRKLHFGEE